MKKFKVELYLSFVIVVLSAIFMRLIPHIPNVSPIAALALFSGAFIPSWGALILPIAALVISDFFLGFHATVPFVYGSFIFIIILGYVLRGKISPLFVGAGSLIGSVLFFIITNFGVWATSSMYEKSVYGLLQCYTMGLPFFRNTILGDLFYAAVFFLSYRICVLLFVLMLPSRRKSRERHAGNTV